MDSTPDPLPPAVRPALLRHSAAQALRAGKALFYQDDRADRAYLVRTGTLKRVMYRSDESTAELGRCGPGEWLGLAELMLESVYLADAVAETACELLAFSHQGIARLLDTPSSATYLLMQVSRQHYRLHARVEVNLPLDRTVRFLLDRAEEGLTITCTQEEVAEAVGLTRETVNRHLSQLASQGLLRVGRGVLTILDTVALSRHRTSQ